MYIRTNDGIYDGEKYDADYFLDMNLGKVVKQSDNLAELCDMFVTLENLDGSVWHSLNFTLCDDLRKDRNNEGVYGAIWCEWGLKYVAKLDDKGELQLL